MTSEERNTMRVLCQRIVAEKDLQKFSDLVCQLDSLLQSDEQTLIVMVRTETIN
jgi:hypothetical protein